MMQGTPTDFWAKIRTEGNRVVEWHPLLGHSADVAAVTEALLLRTLLGDRLARLAGLVKLSPVQVARLCVLAVLHDAGKCNLGFQSKARARRPPWATGHLSPIVNLLFTQRSFEERPRLLTALAVEELAGWTSEEGLSDLLVATFSHHGRPVPSQGTDYDERWWRPADGVDPMQGIAELVAASRRWFPAAWEDAGEEHRLPEAPRFQHGWAGLLMLADWMGSTERLFPFAEPGEGDRMPLARRRAAEAVRGLGLDVAEPRRLLAADPPAYGFMPQPFTPHPAQARMLEVEAPEEGSAVVLEAATGAGKTEAALAHFLRLFHAGRVDGLYFALPTRTAATQIYRRVCRAMAGAFPREDHRPPVVLAVPGYLRVDGAEGQRLDPYQVRWPDENRERFHHRGWAAEHSKRYLAGAVAVGTVDQALLSTLTVSHAHLRSSALLRHLLVVDEVHASDLYMTRLLEDVLDHHLRAGGHALLMSATLGAAARVRLTAQPGLRAQAAVPPLDEARHHPYPAITVAGAGADAPTLLPVEGQPQSKAVHVETARLMDDPARLAARALAEARRGARVLVIRNTVADCRATQQALEELAGEGDRELLFSCRGVPAPHHSRFAGADRRLLDDAVEGAFGKEERAAGGCVAVATQTVEQSLDLDADLMFTDLAPMDVLLQRIGRLHRHDERVRPAGFEAARVVVLVPDVRDLGEAIHDSGESRGKHGLNDKVYRDLRVLETTWRLLESRDTWTLPADNRKLVEGATHPEVLAAVVEQGGEVWVRHERHLLGKGSAERRLADLNVVARDAGFWEPAVLFPNRDEKRNIPTRLGEEDRQVLFPEPAAGPFGVPIPDLTIPAFLAEGVPAEAVEAEEVSPREGGFTFVFGGRSYAYDRTGLSPAAAEATADAPREAA